MAHYDTAPKPLYSVFSYKDNAYLYKDSDNSILFDKDKTNITKKDYKFLFSLEEIYKNEFKSCTERKPFDCSLIEGVEYDISKQRIKAINNCLNFISKYDNK